MTVSELISLLSEMDENEPVMIGINYPYSGDVDYLPVAGSVYSVIVYPAGGDDKPVNAVVITGLGE